MRRWKKRSAQDEFDKGRDSDHALDLKEESKAREEAERKVRNELLNQAVDFLSAGQRETVLGCRFEKMP